MHRLFSLCGPAFVVATLAAIIGLDSGSPGNKASGFANFVALLGTLVWIFVVGVLRARPQRGVLVASPVPSA